MDVSVFVFFSCVVRSLLLLLLVGSCLSVSFYIFCLLLFLSSGVSLSGVPCLCLSFCLSHVVLLLCLLVLHCFP